MQSKKSRMFSWASKANKALKEAVRQVVEDHKRTGRPLVVWSHGKVVRVPANRLPARS